MSWIQENKFVAGLAGATIIVGSAILYYGISKGSAYSKTLEEYNHLKTEYAQSEKLKPYPTAEHEKARRKGIEKYEKTIDEVRDIVMGYRPEKLPKLTPEQFKDEQVKMIKDLEDKFAKVHAKCPENCQFGFEKYATRQVKASATPKLQYEMKALHWLLQKLAAVEPTAVINIRREELKEEKGQVVTTNKRKHQRKKHVAAGRAYELMPVELTFTAPEDAVKDFLLAMVNSKEYFYSIRALRIRNEKQIAPNQKDANFPTETPNSATDGFGGADSLFEDSADGSSIPDAGEGADNGDGSSLPGESVEKPEVPKGELILKQVLGNEKLHVHIRFDIVLIEKKSEKKTKQRHSNSKE